MTAQTAFHALVVAAGLGLRAGLDAPKQFMPLADRPVLRWSVEAFLAHPTCASVLVVTHPDPQMRAMAETALEGLDVIYTTGGEERQASVAAGLALLDAAEAPLVLVHDAARPGLEAGVIDRLLAALGADQGADGAVPALPVADTLAQKGQPSADALLGDAIDRTGLVRVQTPQAFRLDLLLHAHRAFAGQGASDDAQLVRAAGGRVMMVEGEAMLEKITHADDLAMMEARLSTSAASRAPAQPAHAMRAAVGMGFDVHRLVPGDGVWLGGVRIHHDHRLEGHSDADVLLHAITDAVLGAIGAGDIGDHFPPSDAAWRGAASSQFLAHAVALACAQGAQISHIDCTILCEAPKIGPHKAALRASIAAICGVDEQRVSIKATTTERLGFTGRGEGIAAQAVVTLMVSEGGTAV